MWGDSLPFASNRVRKSVAAFCVQLLDRLRSRCPTIAAMVPRPRCSQVTQFTFAFCGRQAARPPPTSLKCRRQVVEPVAIAPAVRTLLVSVRLPDGRSQERIVRASDVQLPMAGRAASMRLGDEDGWVTVSHGHGRPRAPITRPNRRTSSEAAMPDAQKSSALTVMMDPPVCGLPRSVMPRPTIHTMPLRCMHPTPPLE